MKWHRDHVEWAPYMRPDGVEAYQCWFYFTPNWLPSELRYFGLCRDWHDGPIISFGFWWFNVAWSALSSAPPFDFCDKSEQAKWAGRPRWVRRVCGMESYQSH